MRSNIRNFHLNETLNLFSFLCTALEKITDTFEFFTGLKGFHVFCITVNWVPYVGQNIIFKCEYKNKHDRFALAGKTLSEGHIKPVTVRYVPRELS